jgi:hypothetical protein
MSSLAGIAVGARADELVRAGQANARSRLAAAIRTERRTSHQPPGTPTRDDAVEGLRNAEAVAAEWMV